MDLPNSENWRKPIGITPQCKPKITNSCQEPVNNAPNKRGLNAFNQVNKAPIKLDAQVATGPIINNEIGVAINSVNTGTKVPDRKSTRLNSSHVSLSYDVLSSK